MINRYEKLESIRTDKNFFGNLPKKQNFNISKKNQTKTKWHYQKTFQFDEIVKKIKFDKSNLSKIPICHKPDII